MIGRLNHVAIAVPDLKAAVAVYRDTLGAHVSEAVDQPEHGVTTVFIELPNTKIELLGLLGEGSPIAAFLERNPNGGIHHLCYEVPDIKAARDRLVAQGARVLGHGRAQDRRARQARAVPAPEGFLRYAGRARGGVSRDAALRHRALFHHLVDRAVRHAADRRPHLGGVRREDRAGQRRERAASSRTCCPRCSRPPWSPPSCSPRSMPSSCIT